MISTRSFIIVWILLALAGSYQLLHADLLVPLNRPFSRFPDAVRDWQMVSQDTFDSDTLAVLRPTDYLSRTYAGRDGARVQLYIGYHGGGREGGEIHSPKHCLPGSGWVEVSSKMSVIDCDGTAINLVKAVYTRDEMPELIYYWYQARDRTLADEYSLKLAEIVNSITERRRDAAFIRIAVPDATGTIQASATAERFINDFYPAIREFLPH